MSISNEAWLFEFINQTSQTKNLVFIPIVIKMSKPSALIDVKIINYSYLYQCLKRELQITSHRCNNHMEMAVRTNFRKTAFWIYKGLFIDNLKFACAFRNCSFYGDFCTLFHRR